MHVPAMKPIGQAMMVVVGLLIGLMLVSPPISAQLNRVAPSQITCAAGRILAGGTPTTCTATPTISGLLTAAGITSTGTVASTFGGSVTVTGVFAPQSSTNAGAATAYGWNGRSAISTTADKLLQIIDSGGTTGTEINGGTPTLGTCTGGSMTSGSHNSALEVTGNTSGSCVINFGTPNFTNAPICTLNDESALIAVQVSARSSSSITVTGAGSGNNFQVICLGTIGT